MNIENAIVLLSKRADYAQQKADTIDKQRKAATYVEIVNCVIDFYNSIEAQMSQLKNLQKLARILLEHIGVQKEDIPTLLSADSDFVEYNLLVESYKAWEQYPEADIQRQDWIFHNIVRKWIQVQDDKRSIELCRNLVLPSISTRLSKDCDDVLGKQSELLQLYISIESLLNDEENRVTKATDYSDKGTYETYFNQLLCH